MKSPGSVSETDRRALLRAYRENGDVAARDRLIESFIPVVRSIAYRYAGRGEQIDDLEQVASVGLIKAIERFDLDRDVELMTYVFPTVVGELKRHFRDRGWSVTVPRRLKELHYRLSRLIEDLTATLGRSPDDRGARGGDRSRRGRSRRGARSRPRVLVPLAHAGAGGRTRAAAQS